MKNIFSLIAIAALLLVTSCSSSKVIGNLSKIGKEQSSLSNTSWKLVSSNKGNTTPTIRFDPEAGLQGNAGCNKIFSQNVVIRSSNGDFAVNNIASTKMICPNMDMDFERNFIKLLESADKYVITDNQLELFKGKLLLLKFRRIP